MYALRTSTLILLVASTCYSWTPISPRCRVTPSFSTTLSMAKSGKGFGAAPEPPKKKAQEEQVSSSATASSAKPASTPPPVVPMNQGQKALENMRREQAEKRDAELRKVKEIITTDDLVREDAGAAAIPEKVAMRMGKRMLPFVGIPLFGGMGAFVAFWYFATYRDLEFQPALVAVTTIVLLAFGLLGITYSMMSASWDPEREGSALGFDEFSRNVNNLKEGLSRSKENAVIRERMAGMPESEIQAAIRELDKRDELKKKKEQTLKSKIGSELE
mmetsp:Transcript_10423/g.14727  ORF Transcript_10423/g.14727 Transcript_10423/m.14727 type:complete len:274 (+) Transcript_10423:166-987(+)